MAKKIIQIVYEEDKMEKHIIEDIIVGLDSYNIESIKMLDWGDGLKSEASETLDKNGANKMEDRIRALESHIRTKLYDYSNSDAKDNRWVLCNIRGLQEALEIIKGKELSNLSDGNQSEKKTKSSNKGICMEELASVVIRIGEEVRKSGNLMLKAGNLADKESSESRILTIEMDRDGIIILHCWECGWSDCADQARIENKEGGKYHYCPLCGTLLAKFGSGFNLDSSK